MSDGYQPGVCNIGTADQRRRRRIGLLGITIGLVLTGYGYWQGSFGMLHQSTIVAAFITGWTGILQWKMQFCVGFALLGQHSLENGLSSITDNTQRRKDLIQAAKIQFLAVGLGLLSAGLVISPITSFL